MTNELIEKNKIKMDIKKYIFTVLIVFTSTFSYSQNGDQAFYFTTNAIAGEEASIAYNSNKTILKDESRIEGIIYYWKNYAWIAQDMDMVKNDSLWIARVNIPDSTALIVCKFYAGDKVDTGNVYGHFTKNEEQKNFPSSYAGWGLLRGENSQRYGIPGLIKDSAFLIKDDVLLYWFNQELAYFPNERKHIFKYALEAQGRVNPDKCREQTFREVDFVLNNQTDTNIPEQTYIDCIKALQSIKSDSLADAIKQNALEKYPDGILARDKVIWSLFREADPQKKEADLEKLIKRFPTLQFKDIDTEVSDLYYGKIFQSVIYNQIVTNNDYGLLYKYIGDIPYNYLSIFFWHIVQIPYRNNERTGAQLLPYADLIMNEIGNRPRTAAQLIYSLKEWYRMQYDRTKDAILAYAQILDETGDTPKAMALLDSIEPYYKNKSAEFNNIYVQTLIKSNRKGEVTAVIKNGIKENAASPEMLDLLKQDYVKEEGSDQGFDDYVNSIKSSDLVAIQQQKLRESIVDLPIKLFEVERLSGERVDMAQMSGKIIVIDFWATWCAPCIAAMPGMQMAVNKYKKDNDVAFFFLSTLESVPDYKDRIKTLMKQKGYAFDVVLDQPNKASKTADLIYSTYAKDFKFSGIPQKMIIDGKGRLRWRSTGYAGSPSELADEISYIIDLLKNEEK